MPARSRDIGGKMDYTRTAKVRFLYQARQKSVFLSVTRLIRSQENNL